MQEAWGIRGVVLRCVICAGIIISGYLPALAQSNGESEERRRAYLEEMHLLFPAENEWPDERNKWIRWLNETGELPPDFEAIKSIPFIPDPLRMENGEPVILAAEWPLRQEEIRKQMMQWLIGKVPEPPRNLRVKKETIRNENHITIHDIVLEFGPDHKATLSFEMILPKGEGPFPVFMTQDNHRRWALVAVSRGYAGVVYAGADSKDDTEAWLNVYPDYDWSLMARRAWGASRVLDYLETLDFIEQDKVALTGHSRNGKLSVIAGALDPRFGAIISSSSGAGGVNTFRFFSESEFAEGIEILTRRFPDWFHPRLRFFTGREDKLPIDTPNMVAAIAPAPFLYAVALNDNVESVWDIEHSWRSAKKVYDLLGAGDNIQLLYRPGTHETKARDIEEYLDWLDVQLNRKPLVGVVNDALYPAFQDWERTVPERLSPDDFPDKSPDDLLSDIAELDDFHQQWDNYSMDIRKRIRAGLGTAPPEATSFAGSYGSERGYISSMLSRRAPGSAYEGIGSLSLNFGNYIAGDIYYPEEAVERGDILPVIIWIHPISVSNGYRAGYRRGHPTTLALAAQGYAVFAFDQIGHGTRIEEASRFYERYPGWTLLGKMVHDIKQAVNALIYEPLTEYDEFGDTGFLDTGQIYLLGFAMGGRAALHAAALDERIAGVISIAGFTPMRLDTEEKHTGGLARWSKHYPLQPWLADFIGKEKHVPYDYHEVMAAVAPRKVSVITPKIDTQAVPEEVKNAVQQVRPVFERMGAGEHLRFKTAFDYNRFGPEMQQVLYDELRSMLIKPLEEVNPAEAPKEESLIAINGARLIDGLGGPPVDDAVVIVKNNRIIAAGSRYDIEIPADAERFDASGKTLIPGLIDAHFHSIMNNDLLSDYLQRGVTSLRDPGHPFSFYQSLNFTDKPLPRVFLTGAHLDGFPPVWPQQAVVVRDGAHARETVRKHVEEGGTGIKIYYRLPLEYYDDVTKTAREAGVPVMAHLELVDADDAIRAGVNGIEHVTSFGTALADTADAREFKNSVKNDDNARSDERYRLWSKIDLEHERVKEVIGLAIQNNVVFSPTLALFERREGEEGVEDYHVEGFRNMLKFTEMANRAGMKIVTGSHVYGIQHATFGWSYQREMEMLAEAGLSPLEVISSSTIQNARYLRSEQRIGSIENGKIADLVLVDGSPDMDIRNMYNITRVMLNGKWVK
ncbi:MAG: alpha/beta fold hydrolase [Balneolaceae bacterium]|nr:MAG: alpha/beta fold hydrolase [Balneolaceae bacterium]